MIDVREALLVLAHVIEPADEFMGRFVDQVGPVQALERIRLGNVPKRDASGLQARLRSFSFADALLAVERTGSPPVQSTTVVGSRLQAPASMTPAMSFS